MVITKHRDVTSVYQRKLSCPRDHGYWYCEECVTEFRESLQGERTDPTHPIGCGKVICDKRCGKTHLGYSWCEACIRTGQDKAGEAVAHCGEYETAKTIASVWSEE